MNQLQKKQKSIKTKVSFCYYCQIIFNK
jgi:hypothetical protein